MSVKPATTTTSDPARIAAEKIVRVFSAVCNMHVNDILPDIEEACAETPAYLEGEAARLREANRILKTERARLLNALRDLKADVIRRCDGALQG